jgi:hypothetical protein
LRMELSRVVFPTPGPPDDYWHFGNESDANSLSLAIGERRLRLPLDPRDRLVSIDRWPRRFSDCERLEAFPRFPARPWEAGEEDATVALKIIGDYRVVFELHAEGRFYELYRHFEPLCVNEMSSSADGPHCPSSLTSVSA